MACSGWLVHLMLREMMTGFQWPLLGPVRVLYFVRYGLIGMTCNTREQLTLVGDSVSARLVGEELTDGLDEGL